MFGHIFFRFDLWCLIYFLNLWWFAVIVLFWNSVYVVLLLLCFWYLLRLITIVFDLCFALCCFKIIFKIFWVCRYCFYVLICFIPFLCNFDEMLCVCDVIFICWFAFMLSFDGFAKKVFVMFSVCLTLFFDTFKNLATAKIFDFCLILKVILRVFWFWFLRFCMYFKFCVWKLLRFLGDLCCFKKILAPANISFILGCALCGFINFWSLSCILAWIFALLYAVLMFFVEGLCLIIIRFHSCFDLCCFYIVWIFFVLSLVCFWLTFRFGATIFLLGFALCSFFIFCAASISALFFGLHYAAFIVWFIFCGLFLLPFWFAFCCFCCFECFVVDCC